jgi:hypothetical protein
MSIVTSLAKAVVSVTRIVGRAEDWRAGAPDGCDHKVALSIAVGLGAVTPEEATAACYTWADEVDRRAGMRAVQAAWGAAGLEGAPSYDWTAATREGLDVASVAGALVAALATLQPAAQGMLARAVLGDDADVSGFVGQPIAVVPGWWSPSTAERQRERIVASRAIASGLLVATTWGRILYRRARDGRVFVLRG